MKALARQMAFKIQSMHLGPVVKLHINRTSFRHYYYWQHDGYFRCTFSSVASNARLQLFSCVAGGKKYSRRWYVLLFNVSFTHINLLEIEYPVYIQYSRFKDEIGVNLRVEIGETKMTRVNVQNTLVTNVTKRITSGSYNPPHFRT